MSEQGWKSFAIRMWIFYWGSVSSWYCSPAGNCTVSSGQRTVVQLPFSTLTFAHACFLSPELSCTQDGAIIRAGRCTMKSRITKHRSGYKWTPKQDFTVFQQPLQLFTILLTKDRRTKRTPAQENRQYFWMYHQEYNSSISGPWARV